MGYRFSINNANAVGHLVEGNVLMFLEQSFLSDSQLLPNLEFIDGLLGENRDDFYTSAVFWDIISPEIYELRNEWRFLKAEIDPSRDFSRRFTKYFLENNGQLHRFLLRISQLLSRCKVKSLLLPGFNDRPINELLIDSRVLKDLVEIHPGDTALILQLKEQIQQNTISVLSAFSKFETAYSKIEQWPGVLLWDDTDSIFIPVKEKRELYRIYEAVKYEKSYISYLKRNFENKQADKKYAYLFHLSDLHFGNGIAEKTKSRTLGILSEQVKKLEDAAIALPIITGDLMQSPNNTNKQAYTEFADQIKAKGFAQPIHILGNHDIDNSGIFKRLTEQKAVISSLSSSGKIELLEKLNLAIIKFDSNTGGKLAQGEIGSQQMMEVGNEIDAIENKEKYTFIALLHHHPKEIENPTWYSRDWYEALLGKTGFEIAMKLTDADLFLEWIEKRGIKYILHGHKHIPNIQTHNEITIMAAGSSTGSVKHKEAGKTYLSYNLIKYDIESKTPVSCSIIAEDVLGAGAKNILVQKI